MCWVFVVCWVGCYFGGLGVNVIYVLGIGGFVLLWSGVVVLWGGCVACVIG